MEPRRAEPIAYATPTLRGRPSPDAMVGAAVGWRSVAGVAWLAGVLAAAWLVVATLCDQQQAVDSARMVYASPARSAAQVLFVIAGPLAFALAVGAVSPLILYFWSVRRTAWVVVLPALAGAWTIVGVVRATDPSDPSAPLPMAAFAALIQCGVVYGGTHSGRPIARWLTRQLVPPPLRASLLVIWS